MTFTDPRKVNWTELRIAREEVVRQKDMFKKELPSFLGRLNTEQRQRLSNILFGESLSEKDKFLQLILEGKSLDLLLHLHEFSKGKAPLLREYFSKLKFKTIILHVFDEDPLLFLTEAYCKSPSFLREALYFVDYKKSKGIRYVADSPLKKEQNELISSVLKSIRKFISRKYKRRGFAPIFHYNDGKSFYHVFYREKETKITETYHGGQKLTGKSALFVVLHPEENILEIRCGDPYVRGLVKRSIEKKLQVKLVEYRLRESMKDASKDLHNFLVKKLDDNPDKIILERINLKEGGPNPEASFIIGKKGWTDIRHILHALEQNDLIDLEDMQNVTSFSVRFKTKSFGISVKTNIDGTFSFELGEGIPVQFIKGLRERLKNEGILLNTFIEQEPDDSEFPMIFSRLLRFHKSRKLSLFEENLLNRMIESKIIKTRKITINRCSSNPRHTVPSSGRCPECESTTIPINEYDKTEPNYTGIRLFVKHLLVRVFGKKNVKDKLKKRYREFPFFEVRYNNNSFYVYVQEGDSPKSLYDFFKSSLMPTIIITTGKTAFTEASKEIFQVLPLRDIYFDTNHSKIQESAKQLRINYDKHLLEASKDAKLRLEACISDTSKSDPESFEDDVFVLLRYLFGTGEQWGHKLRRSVPDGIAGFSVHSKNMKSITKFSLSWDCKYSNNILDFSDQNMKRQIRGYILRTCQAPYVKKFSKTLNAFFMITNSDSENGFKGFSDHQYKITNWKGVNVLLTPSGLIELYTYLVQDTKELPKRRASLLSQLVSYLNEHKQGEPIILNSSYVNKLIESSEFYRKKYDLNISGLSDYLASNIIQI